MDEQFMREAIALSVENVRRQRGGPFAALIVKHGQVIARGANQVTLANDPTAHGEIVAIRAACQSLGSFQLTGCELYTSCEPCPMCLAAMHWARLARFYYGNTRQDAARIGFDDALLYEELERAPEQRKVPGLRLLAAEAAVAFDEWVRSAAKVPY